MSLFQSLAVGVSGLQSQSNKLSVISDNISNANTIGYKGGIANFQTLLTDFSGGTYTPGGVKPEFQRLNQRSGTIIATTSVTDLAISGRGFIPVSSTADGTTIDYTRAGSFSKNLNGDFINSSGYFLKGWRLDNNGDLPTTLSAATLTQSVAEAALETVNVDNLSLDPIPTDLIELVANLKASEIARANNDVRLNGTLLGSQAVEPTGRVNVIANVTATQVAADPLLAYDPLDATHNMASTLITPHYSTSFTVYDSTGAERSVRIGFLKTDTNTWQVEVYAERLDEITPATGLPDGLISYGTVTFDNNGLLATASTTLTDPASVTWTTPDATSDITFGFGAIDTASGLRQTTDGYSSILAVNPDYDPTVSASSMSAGAVAPHYSTTVNVIDNTGATRTVTANFLRTAADTWSVELTALPAAALTVPTGGIAGQIAYGTLKFTEGGALTDISPSLASAINVDWVGNPEINTLKFNWGASAISAGLTVDSSMSAAYATTATVSRNYNPTDATLNMASGAVAPSFNREINVVNAAGELKALNFMFLKTGVNTWAVELAALDAADLLTASPQLAHGLITFNGDGTPGSITASLTDPITVPWSNGAATDITLDLGTAGPEFGTVGATTVGLGDGLTQYNAGYQITSITQNGSQVGENASLSVDSEGYITGRFTNGSVRRLFKIPLADFLGVNNLQALNENVFAISTTSGEATYFQAGEGDGAIQSGALEASNVDLPSELSNMIIAQRSYQSNSKLISVTDSLLETLAGL